MSSRSIESKSNKLPKKIKISTRKMSAEEKKLFNDILDDVDRKEKDGTVEWSHVIGDNPNPIDQMKYQICKTFIRFLNKSGMPQVRLAEMIGVDRARINNIVHGRYQLFSLETLIQYLLSIEGLSPEMDKKIADIKRLTQP